MANDTSHAAIGLRVKLLRLAFDYSQAALGKMLGVSASAVGNWEQGSRRISVDEAYCLCQVTGATFDYIYRAHLDGLPRHLAVKIKQLETDGALSG